ncbi:MAG: hypothetical protein IH921_00295 [Gemmatimonadetes bacterium]|nr:hypothetical protein [Gemmatimonadota bacterium]
MGKSAGRSVGRLATILAVALTACDWGPRGPGELKGIVTSGDVRVGAIVLEISGPGVQGFSEAGQTRVFFAEPETDLYRVVLVTADPDRIRFQVAVDDVRGPSLTVVVIEAVDDSNAAIADLSGIEAEMTQIPTEIVRTAPKNGILPIELDRLTILGKLRNMPGCRSSRTGSPPARVRPAPL